MNTDSWSEDPSVKTRRGKTYNVSLETHEPSADYGLYAEEEDFKVI